MPLRRIIYTSLATEHFNRRGLLDLLHESRGFNSLDNISGVLMHKEGRFVQVIEGYPDELDDLFERLLRDPRHKDVRVILDTTVDSRLFSNWAMGCADFDEPELSMIPGIRTDLNDPQVIEELVARLPEIATFLRENLD
jgi:hypothetical protein